MVSLKVFVLVASVARRINQLEGTVGTMIDGLSSQDLVAELGRAKRLFYMHVRGTLLQTMTLDDLALELKAGGIAPEHEASIIAKLRSEGLAELTLVDFLAYCPLFLGMHDSIVKNPF